MQKIKTKSSEEIYKEILKPISDEIDNDKFWKKISKIFPKQLPTQVTILNLFGFSCFL